MKYVQQKDDFGCGVACVANRLEICYEEALNLFDDPSAASSVGYACKFIVQALRTAGVNARLRHISIKKPLPDYLDGDIVLLVRSDKYPFQHYLMKCHNGWVDPWINMENSKDVRQAVAGVRKELPGRPYYRITVS